MKQDFTKGRIFAPLFKFALPVFLAMLLQVMYGAVDLIVVGKYSETVHVAAVSTGSSITHSITVVLVGLSMGATVLLGQNLGEGKSEKAGIIIGGNIVFFGIIGIALSIIMPFLSNPLCRVMNAPKEAFDLTVSYVFICMLGSVFIVAYNLLGSILRGMGDSKTPLLAVGIACVANIIGDLIFVAVFSMGSKGAAIATVTAQAVSVIICFFILAKRELPFEFKKKHIKHNSEVTKGTVRLGMPLALQELLVQISFLVILAIVNALGLTASAAIGVAQKITGFVMLVPSSLSQSLSAFVAHNYGAGEYRRARKSLFYVIGISFFCAIWIFILTFFKGNLLTGLFSKDPEVINAAADYLKAFSIDVLLTSFMFCYNGFFNGCGKTRFVMFHGIFGAFCIRIPVSYIMSRQVPVSLFHIGLATPCSTFVQCIFCTIYFLHLKKQLNGKAENVDNI